MALTVITGTAAVLSLPLDQSRVSPSPTCMCAASTAALAQTDEVAAVFAESELSAGVPFAWEQSCKVYRSKFELFQPQVLIFRAVQKAKTRIVYK